MCSLLFVPDLGVVVDDHLELAVGDLLAATPGLVVGDAQEDVLIEPSVF